MRKKIILLIAVISVVYSVRSQTKFGIEAGGVYNGMFASNVEISPKFSYRVGGFVNYNQFWGSGIAYARKSAELSGFLPQYAGYIQKLDIAMNQVELVPLSLRFSAINIGRDFSITPVLSVYCLYGFSGKGTITGIDTRLSESENTFHKEIGNLFKDSRFEEGAASYSYKGFKPFDAGGKIGVDFTYQKNYMLRFNYAAGLINLSSYDKKLRNSSLELSLCYLFP